MLRKGFFYSRSLTIAVFSRVGTREGDEMAVSAADDDDVTTGVGDVRTGTGAGNVSAVSVVDNVAVTIGVGDVGKGTS